MDHDKQPIVLMISPCGGGGIRSVVEALLASDLSKQCTFKWICSHFEGSLAQRIARALLAYVQVLSLSLRSPSLIFHVHVAAYGSFFRKSLFIWLAKGLGHPTILHMHASSFNAFYEGSPSWVRRYVRAVMNRSTAIIALSQSLADYYATLTITPITVIPNFIKDSEAQPQFDKDGQQMLFLGRYGLRKGIYDVIDALPRLVSAYPDVRLICAGDGDVETLRQHVTARHLEAHVTLNEWVEGSTKDELIRGASIFLLPSHAEGLPMAILEAMEAGLCIVTTPVGGIPEVIKDGVNGRIVPVGQATALSELLATLIGDVEQQRILGRRAREDFVEHFSEKVVIPKFFALYRTLDLGYLAGE